MEDLGRRNDAAAIGLLELSHLRHDARIGEEGAGSGHIVQLKRRDHIGGDVRADRAARDLGEMLEPDDGEAHAAERHAEAEGAWLGRTSD